MVWLQARGHCALVLTDELARGDPIAGMALTLGGLQVWVAPTAMVEGVRQVTAVASRPPRHTAALLARWPSVPSLRQHLRMAVPDTDNRQLALW